MEIIAGDFGFDWSQPILYCQNRAEHCLSISKKFQRSCTAAQRRRNESNSCSSIRPAHSRGQSRLLVSHSAFFNVFTLPICNRCAIHTNQRHGCLLPQTPRDARLLPIGLRFAPVPTVHNVVHSPGVLNPKFARARHSVARVPSARAGVKRKLTNSRD